MKPYKLKFKVEFADGFAFLVNQIIEQNKPETDDDKLLVAALVEVKEKLMKKTMLMQEKYSTRLSPVQAIAMRMLYTNYMDDHTSYMGNALLKISNEVHQKFSL